MIVDFICMNPYCENYKVIVNRELNAEQLEFQEPFDCEKCKK